MSLKAVKQLPRKAKSDLLLLKRGLVASRGNPLKVLASVTAFGFASTLGLIPFFRDKSMDASTQCGVGPLNLNLPFFNFMASSCALHDFDYLNMKRER